MCTVCVIWLSYLGHGGPQSVRHRPKICKYDEAGKNRCQGVTYTQHKHVPETQQCVMSERSPMFVQWLIQFIQ